MKDIEILREVDSGTEMGDYLRAYWYPIASTVEFDDNATKAVRILGEDLVIYKDLDGRYGLVDRMCAHRNADLSYGYVEKNGLRCPYHGWMYGSDGKVIEAPYEDTVNPDNNIRRDCKLKSYRVRELAGLLFAYLGPDPAPELPVYEFFNWTGGIIEIVRTDTQNNWLQHQENSYDPVHFEWSHENWDVRIRGGNETQYSAKFLDFEFQEFDHGYHRPRKRVDEKQDPRTRLIMWPNSKIRYFAGKPRKGENSEYGIGKTFIKYIVPVDKNNSYYMVWNFLKMPEGAKIPEDNVIYFESSLYDGDGKPDITIQLNQDIVVCGGHGFFPETRRNEYLGETDRGVVMFRKKLFEELERFKVGFDPKGVIRDPEAAKNVIIPIFENDEEERKRFKFEVPYDVYVNSQFYKRRVKRLEVENKATPSDDPNIFPENNTALLDEALEFFIRVVDSAKT
jgi:5,5'-dehydrodivanillate O-demethylase oxygenase subunit